ncbi:hypothetical protein IHN32_01030 [Deinococcus sp. 14RED07]|uniref:hypothetical protein n=1 Tax=unclassified Deinococcus TaxID=2623546 RepID=UPI001E3AC49B|nr:MULTISPECIES: hypothetical protein [unclassified Deinococcus]MCD0155704.1 hypothetical protein [Deinococcus sp. 6GRE01]MCD0174539.1 hypothetical protein [Deinococcus sp. 14RED07]
MSETSTSSDMTPSFTLTDLANRLGVHHRSALRLLNDYAAYLQIPVYTGHRRQLQISSADFERVVELAELLRVIGLNVQQFQRLQCCDDPRLWSLLKRPGFSNPAATDDRLARFESSLADFLRKQETVMKQQIDLLHHVVSLLPAAPAPTTTPVPAPARREPRE